MKEIKILSEITQGEITKEGLQWLLNKYDNCSDRYIEAERFIMEIAEMPWYKRMFLTNKIIKFLESVDGKI